MWTQEGSKGYEASKCRYRIASYLRGIGLDLGCGSEKICETAIGIDNSGDKANIHLDLAANDSLRIFSDNHFDYVFSSHCLEDFIATEGILTEWWRVIKPGGHLILYGPDKDYYPRIGTPGANPNHKHDFYWQDIWRIVKKFGNARLVSASRHNLSNEYSWQLIIRKKAGLIKKPWNILLEKKTEGCIAFPRKKKAKKECLIIRYGALGDAVWVTPALKQLKKQGYYIVYNCTEYSAQVLRENPYIDKFLFQDTDVVPNKELAPYWQEIGKSFDKVINFCESVEGSLLKMEGTDEFNWSHKRRHRECNVNYMDRTMAVAGFPEKKGQLPELFFSPTEEYLACLFREHYKDKFVIEVSLSGSAQHKTYPWMPYLIKEIHNNYDDVVVVTVGDYTCRLLENWQDKNTINRAGVWTVRQSMIMTKYVDLVFGTETGILNAASCYDTPKIVLLSHSSIENLTKYWKNCTSIHARSCNCHPCHRLIYTLENTCRLEEIKIPYSGGMAKVKVPECMSKIRPEEIYKAFQEYYNQWKEKEK
jgi:ADP-heptose:LPS heptosyltransferase/predicted SAM-dependent methyltransferase